MSDNDGSSPHRYGIKYASKQRLAPSNDRLHRLDRLPKNRVVRPPRTSRWSASSHLDKVTAQPLYCGTSIAYTSLQQNNTRFKSEPRDRIPINPTPPPTKPTMPNPDIVISVIFGVLGVTIGLAQIVLRWRAIVISRCEQPAGRTTLSEITTDTRCRRRTVRV